jgi:hypothetical protein
MVAINLGHKVVAGRSWKGAYLDLVVRQRPVVAIRLGLRSPIGVD